MTRATEAEARRLRLALELADFGIEVMRQNLRRRHRRASARRVNELLNTWLLDRPGAEAGDGVGVVVQWPKRRRR